MTALTYRAVSSKSTRTSVGCSAGASSTGSPCTKSVTGATFCHAGSSGWPSMRISSSRYAASAAGGPPLEAICALSGRPQNRAAAAKATQT